MNKEEIYTFNEYVLGYDKGNNDRSCLTISKIQNGNMYVMSSLYDGSADIISMILDNLQQENKQLKEQLLVTQTNEETYRLEMEDITQTLGLDEDTIFDDVKAYVRSLEIENKKYKEAIDKAIELLNNHTILLPTEYSDEVANFKRNLRNILKEVE